MPELARVIKQDLDISQETEVLGYNHSGFINEHPCEVIARVDLGDTMRPIAGGGSYQLNIYIDDVVVSPTSNVDVAAGKNRTILVSRAFALEYGDQVSIRVKGLPADTAVNVISMLRDVSPAQVEDLVGRGGTLVDHNFGSADALAVMTNDSVRVDNAAIWAFRAADYQAGKRGFEFVVASTTTDVDGRWRQALMLDKGSYVLVVFKQNVIKPKAVSLTVS